MNLTLTDARLRKVMGLVLRDERSRIIPGCDRRIFQLPCPNCLPIYQKPYSLILDLRTDRYRCRLCHFDIAMKEIEDAAKEES